MKKNLVLKVVYTFFIFIFIADFSLFALTPGKGVPRLSAEKWYRKKADNEKRLQAVILLDLTRSDAFALLRMLENMASSALGNDLAITVFAMNEEKTADAILKRLGNYSFSIGLDSRLKMRNLLAEKISLFPYAILADNGVMQWGGMPTELELVAEKVLNKTFSLEKQQRVEGIRKELQIAIQSGLPVVVSSTADRILKILPDDRLAIQSKLFALNAMQQKKEAEKFIEKVCRDNPKDVRLKVMQLDFLLREGKRKEFVQKVSAGYQVLKDSKDLLLFASYALMQAPFGVLDVHIQLLLASRVYKNLSIHKNKASAVQKALAAEIYARALYMAGRLEEAVKLQEEALGIRKGTSREEAAKALLAYYRSALAASGKWQKNEGRKK